MHRSNRQIRFLSPDSAGVFCGFDLHYLDQPRTDFDAVLRQFGHRRVLVWDWPAMPAPPPSPVYVERDGGLVDKVVFHVELTVDDAVITSNEVVLKVGW